MAGAENLIPVTERTKDEARDISSKGGVASGKARRMKRTLREGLREILALDLPESEGRALLVALGVDPDYASAINMALVRRAMTGEVDAFRAVRDSIGEKPSDALEIGNLDDKPLETIDLSKLTDEQLRMMIAKRQKPEAE